MGDERLRVLFIGGTRYDRPLGGMHRNKFATLQPISENYVFGYSTTNRFQRFSDGATFYLIPVKFPWPIRYPIFLSAAVAVAVYLIWRRRIQVLIGQSIYEGSAAALAKLLIRPFRRRVSVVCELHGDWEAAPALYRGDRSQLLLRFIKTINRAIARFAFRYADLFRTISEFTTAKLGGWGKKPVITFPAYTDLDLFLDEHKNGTDLRQRSLILYAGMLRPVKGVHVLIRAFKIVADRHLTARLWIAGDGPERGRLEQSVTQLGLDERVSFLGFLDQTTLKHHMERSSMVVVPSLSEGLSRVAVEAMACGTAVIGSAVGGLPELIRDGETGVLVPPDDVEALAERISYLIEHAHLAAEMGERGREFVVKRFSNRSYSESFAEMLAMALQEIR
ncbi:MAG: glycosyltransferase family 4 protein [Candidatus Bipolaricaulia bacterium]